MKEFSIDVEVAGTVYIKADTLEEAQEILDKAFAGEPLCTFFSDKDSHPIYDDPQIGISPAVTIYGPWKGQKLDEV